MKPWLKLVFQTIKVFILFTGCTILFYYGIMWLNEEYQDYHHNEPKGAAVKVFASGNDDASSGWLERLILFYLSGE